MNIPFRLSDVEHPLVQEKAIELTRDESTLFGKLECIFTYVRDGIKFGIPPKNWFVVKASETISYGLGQCSAKSALFVALCRSAGIPAMIHGGWIDYHVLEGLLSSIDSRFMPKTGNHVWADVQIEGQWKSIDTFIVDKALYEGALRKLKESGKTMGYGVALIDGKASCEFNFGEKGFVQMGAVLDDHGRWDDLSEYFASRYMKLTAVETLALKYLAPRISLRTNAIIEKVRATAAS